MSRLILTLCLYFLAAKFLCNIDVSDSYSWYSGIWHGLFFIPNFILSWFSNTAYKASNQTIAYNIFWWTTTILNILGIFLGGGKKNKSSY